MACVQKHVAKLVGWNGPLTFLVTLIIHMLFNIRFSKCADEAKLMFLACMSINFCGILVSIVATLVNWKTHKFDSHTPSVIHSWPFLG